MNSSRPQRGPMLLVGSLLLGLACAGAGSNANATPTIYYLSTGQTGAQTQIDTFHSTTWAFTATSDWELGGGNFTMKDGSSTTDDVMLTVYEGVDSTGPQVAQIDLTNASFCTLHGGNCQNFNTTPFYFVDGSNDPAPLSIANGQSYFVALTSTAPNDQN